MATCPHCGGNLIAVCDQAWCLKPRAVGGCGAAWIWVGSMASWRWCPTGILVEAPAHYFSNEQIRAGLPELELAPWGGP